MLSSTAESVVKALDEYFKVFGQKFPVKNVLSDNGSCFKSQEFIDALVERKIVPNCTSTYSPHVNLAERIMSRIGDLF